MEYKVLEHRPFSTKRHLVDMNARNRMIKTCICLYAIYETVTSRNVPMESKIEIIGLQKSE